jgi:hypothetical protein
MQAPKLLPWIAHNAGIDDVLALKLWRRAASESEELCGSRESADYFNATMMRFLDLVEQESGKQPSKAATARLETAWIWRHQKRLALLNKIATESLGRLWQSNQNYFLPPHTAFAWPERQLTPSH